MLSCKTKIEKAWLVTSVIIMVTHKLLESSSSGYEASSEPLRLWLEMTMLVLSFPLGGLTLFALHDALYWCDDCRNLEFLLDWSTLLFAGYIQWFWLLPEFLRNRKFTFLDLHLGRRQETAAPESSPSPAGATPAPLSVAPAAFEALTHAAQEAAPLPAFDAVACAPALAEFDEAGLTALGRVLQAPSRTHASAPHAETIFPRVS